jgi:hypothetical protein
VLTAETARAVLGWSATLLLAARRGLELATSPSLEQVFGLIKVAAYLLRALAVFLAQGSAEALRALQRWNARCVAFVKELFLDGPLPPLCGLPDEQRCGCCLG